MSYLSRVTGLDAIGIRQGRARQHKSVVNFDDATLASGGTLGAAAAATEKRDGVLCVLSLPAASYTLTANAPTPLVLAGVLSPGVRPAADTEIGTVAVVDNGNARRAKVVAKSGGNVELTPIDVAGADLEDGAWAATSTQVVSWSAVSGCFIAA